MAAAPPHVQQRGLEAGRSRRASAAARRAAGRTATNDELARAAVDPRDTRPAWSRARASEARTASRPIAPSAGMWVFSTHPPLALPDQLVLEPTQLRRPAAPHRLHPRVVGEPRSAREPDRLFDLAPDLAERRGAGAVVDPRSRRGRSTSGRTASSAAAARAPPGPRSASSSEHRPPLAVPAHLVSRGRNGSSARARAASSAMTARSNPKSASCSGATRAAPKQLLRRRMRCH